MLFSAEPDNDFNNFNYYIQLNALGYLNTIELGT